MTITFSVLCLLVAVILFIVAAIGVPSGRFNLVSAGLAFFSLAFLVRNLNVDG